MKIRFWSTVLRFLSILQYYYDKKYKENKDTNGINNFSSLIASDYYVLVSVKYQGVCLHLPILSGSSSYSNLEPNIFHFWRHCVWKL